MKVTLDKAVRLPGRRLHVAGDVIDATESEVEILDRVDAVREDTPNTVTVTKKPKVDTPEENVTNDEKPDGRPAKTAPVAVWQEYLTNKGIDPKGLSKREMIAAVS